MRADVEALPVPLASGALGSTAANPLKPRPPDIETLVKASVPTSFWVECSPNIMSACLALNKENYRPKIQGWIEQLGSDMAAKPTRFKLTGEPISFDIDGLMIDGQNRFWAGVEANFTFVFLFVVGLPKEASEVIGFGRPRKIANVVQRMGYDNAYLLSAAAGWLLRFKKGENEQSGLIRGRSAAGTVEEILDTLKRHPGLHASSMMLKQKGRQIVPGSLLTAIHYVGAVCLARQELADSFINEIRGYPRKARQTGAPFIWLRDLEERQQRNLDTTRDYKARGAVEAWNLFMQSIEVTGDYLMIPDKLSFKDLDYALL